MEWNDFILKISEILRNVNNNNSILAFMQAVPFRVLCHFFIHSTNIGVSEDPSQWDFESTLSL